VGAHRGVVSVACVARPNVGAGRIGVVCSSVRVGLDRGRRPVLGGGIGPTAATSAIPAATNEAKTRIVQSIPRRMRGVKGRLKKPCCERADRGSQLFGAPSVTQLVSVVRFALAPR
jgi:hypothetical protein